jgi:hypothetical protein
MDESSIKVHSERASPSIRDCPVQRFADRPLRIGGNSGARSSCPDDCAPYRQERVAGICIGGPWGYGMTSPAAETSAHLFVQQGAASVRSRRLNGRHMRQSLVRACPLTTVGWKNPVRYRRCRHREDHAAHCVSQGLQHTWVHAPIQRDARPARLDVPEPCAKKSPRRTAVRGSRLTHLVTYSNWLACPFDKQCMR